jgi:hypothetical protein
MPAQSNFAGLIVLARKDAHSSWDGGIGRAIKRGGVPNRNEPQKSSYSVASFWPASSCPPETTTHAPSCAKARAVARPIADSFGILPQGP